MSELGKVCKHGSLERSCQICELDIICVGLQQICELEIICVGLQQEINCLRMEPCQLPHCVKDRAKAENLAEALRLASAELEENAIEGYSNTTKKMIKESLAEFEKGDWRENVKKVMDKGSQTL